MRRRKQSSKENARREHENATSDSAGLKESAKTVDRERKKHVTQGGEGRGLA